MMFSPIWIISISIFLFSFLGILVFASVLFKPIDKYKFSFMRIFPFEIAENSDRYGKYYSLSTYLFSGMCFTPLIIICSTHSLLDNLKPLSILLVCLLGLSSLCFVFLNIFNATHVKTHLSIFTVFASLVLLSSALIFARGLTASNLYLEHGKNEIIFLVTEILSGLATIFSVIIILNPKLKTWPKLDQVDGEYVRPKRFVLAYSQWALLLVLFIDVILLFIQLLVK